MTDKMPITAVIYYLAKISQDLVGMELKTESGYLKSTDVFFWARQYLIELNHIKQQKETPSK